MATDISLALVDRVRIASPCAVKWEEMSVTGDARVRHCERCNLKVHDVSAMARDEAEALLTAHFSANGARVGQRLCAQWRRRADGTIIFGDCPVGLAKVRARVLRSVARVAAVVGFTSLVAACNSATGGSVALGGDVAVPEEEQLGGSVAVPDENRPREAPAQGGAGEAGAPH